MSIEHLDELIEKLNSGDVAAAERAFLAYEPYLRMAIRRQLNGPLRSKLDTMDIVQSVWADVLGGFREAGWRRRVQAALVPVTVGLVGAGALVIAAGTARGPLAAMITALVALLTLTTRANPLWFLAASALAGVFGLV